MNLICQREKHTFTIRYDLYDNASDVSYTQYLSCGWREVDELIHRLSQLRLDHAIEHGDDWPDAEDTYMEREEEPF